MLPHMGRSKALERRYAEHLASVLKPIVERDFENQTQAARAMGIAQSHLSQILMGEGAGIAVLIRVRAFTGMSLDQLLGLPPLRVPVEPPPPPVAEGLPDGTRVYELLKSAVAAMEQQHASTHPPPPIVPMKGSPDAPRRRRR
jgi:transcriptional regulator with XRE-family HTH domain